MKIINGKKIARKILKKIKTKNAALAVILIGNDKASHLYVSIKEKRAKQAGVNYKKYLFAKNVSPKTILNLIRNLNADQKTTAILVQLPLPKHLNTDKIISAIVPEKDADGIHPANLAQLKKGGKPSILPATTGAIIEALKSTKINLKNKSAEIGRAHV